MKGSNPNTNISKNKLMDDKDALQHWSWSLTLFHTKSNGLKIASVWGFYSFLTDAKNYPACDFFQLYKFHLNDPLTNNKKVRDILTQ